MITKPVPIVAARRARGPCHAVASRIGGFTLAELVVSVFVVTIIVLMITQLMTSATAVTRTGNKHIDTDTQARDVLDRMALDFAQMLKRIDVDYFIKQPNDILYPGHSGGHGQGHRPPSGMPLNDQIAFFTQVPGYDPPAGSLGSPSAISLVAYRVNQNTSAGNPAYLRLERMGKRLIWNSAPPPGNDSNNPKPMVFLPLRISAIWPYAIDSTSADIQTPSTYETMGPGVFRLEYYYLLKNGKVTDTPWNTDDPPGHTSLDGIGLSDIEAIAVAIAVIDPAGRALIDAASPGSLFALASDMADFKNARGLGNGAQKIGELEAQWKTVVETVAATGHTASDPISGTPGLPVPPEAAKAIRIYNRYFDLKSL
jgi:hypothetical protein